MPVYLRLVLEAPLLAFGGEAVDARGVIEDFPASSMLTGLLANALGWQRHHRQALSDLQKRLYYAARIDQEGRDLTDFQTVKLGKDDQGWTTRGAPEGRDGGAGTYNSPHIRFRDYQADKRVVVALTLQPAEVSPSLAELAQALDQPARPLFLGRKACLPSLPINAGLVTAENLLAALSSLPPAYGTVATRVLLPENQEAVLGDELRPWSDARNWLSGVHGGGRLVRIRSLRPEQVSS